MCAGAMQTAFLIGIILIYLFPQIVLVLPNLL